MYSSTSLCFFSLHSEYLVYYQSVWFSALVFNSCIVDYMVWIDTSAGSFAPQSWVNQGPLRVCTIRLFKSGGYVRCKWRLLASITGCRSLQASQCTGATWVFYKLASRERAVGIQLPNSTSNPTYVDWGYSTTFVCKSKNRGWHQTKRRDWGSIRPCTNDNKPARIAKGWSTASRNKNLE
jgi:hypothetical protein